MNKNSILYSLFLITTPLIALDHEAAAPINQTLTAEEMLAPIDEALVTEQAPAPAEEPDIENSDFHKVRKSISEELEAVSAYETRIASTSSQELKKIFEHTKNEEKEHIALLVDWLRKNDHEQDSAFKKPHTEH